MKKLVPDPPPVLCVGPGLSHEEAVRRAAEHLKKAITAASSLPEPKTTRHRALLINALLDMKISKALLTVAMSESPVTVPV
ncbi:hypothetical protein [Pseudomonas putida]|uniref:Uncharacterized protein n=1 Tax=Pseudomonas putida TaxID=303 RepID=A0A177SWB7_PSEPU|nr:hypothetical protein [Pseudomonas putida]OAI95099.1 hypothetical protein AYO28_06215 [Pseudomonas putida]